MGINTAMRQMSGKFLRVKGFGDPKMAGVWKYETSTRHDLFHVSICSNHTTAIQAGMTF